MESGQRPYAVTSAAAWRTKWGLQGHPEGRANLVRLGAEPAR